MTHRRAPERILVMAHAHPDFSLGGGEIAAYNLFQAYRRNEHVEQAWFLGRADRGRGASGHIGLRRPGEYLWEQGVSDWHLMKAAHQASLTTWFADLVRALRPSVVHTHHYAHLGLEYLRVIKQVDPGIRLVMTLHEYMAICSHNGQMIKTGNFRLCSRSSPDDCRRCFPQKSAEDFWLRQHYFQSHFGLVDQFVSPSHFLRQRYIDWGLPPAKIAVIENGQSDAPPLAPRPLREGQRRNRFGYFGQINPFKGLSVVLEALTQMGRRERRQIVLEVHGSNLELQAAEFQQKVWALATPLIQDGVVVWVGPYEPHELRQRMAGVDWVVVPSVWWENSPMVIQEAFACARPPLVSDIGGMREKVRHQVDGFHVGSGSAAAWAAALSRLGATAADYDGIVARIRAPAAHQAVAAAHLQLLPGAAR